MSKHKFQPYPKNKAFCGQMIDAYARCSMPTTADVHQFPIVPAEELDEPCKLCDAKTTAAHDPDCPENPVYDLLKQRVADKTMSRPWRAEISGRLSDGSDCWVIDCEDGSVAEMMCPKDLEQATAELIVAAANAYRCSSEVVDTQAEQESVEVVLAELRKMFPNESIVIEIYDYTSVAEGNGYVRIVVGGMPEVAATLAEAMKKVREFKEQSK